MIRQSFQNLTVPPEYSSLPL